MSKVDILLQWAEKHKGNLKPIERKNGTAFLYRVSHGGVVYSKNFPAGTPEDFIKGWIAENEGKLLYDKLGIGEGISAVHRKRERLTLIELLRWYLETSAREGLAQATLEGQEKVVCRFIDWIGGESFLGDDVARSHLNDYKRYMLEKGNKATTARGDLVVIHTIFKKAHYEEKVTAYPFLGFKYPRVDAPTERPRLTIEEMKEMAGVFKSKQTRLAWNIARLTAMRAGDIRRLEAEKIDHEKRIIDFWAAKAHRWERIPFHPALCDHLAPLRGRSGSVFSYRNWHSLAYVFHQKIAEFKGTDFRPCGGHTPRHSVGDYLRNVAKWRWEDIQMMLCHHSRGATRRYTHDSLEHLRELVDDLPFE